MPDVPPESEATDHPVPLPSAIRTPARPNAPREETSAGGLVLDQRTQPARVPLIGRMDRRDRLTWSLPKGHLEPGETAEQAAVREVAEETGITGSIRASLGQIDFWFVAEGRRIHKTVHHYLLDYVSGEINDNDPEVVAVEWVPLPEVNQRLEYADERRLVDRVHELLSDAP